MLSDVQRRFLDLSRVAHLATADRAGTPHLVPVCFCLEGLSLYITVDEKPKRTDVPLKRVRNILENPAVAVTVDRWDEDWTRLGWIMLRGQAEILSDGTEHDAAQEGFGCVIRSIGRWIWRPAGDRGPDSARAVVGGTWADHGAIPRAKIRRASRIHRAGRVPPASHYRPI